MKIICEYCGTSVDVKNNTKCSNCGADLSNNKIFKESINMNFEKEKLEFEKEKLEFEKEKAQHTINQQNLEQNEQLKSLGKFLKTGCSIPFIFFAFMLIIVLIMISCIKEFTDSLVKNAETINTNISQEVLVEGNFNTPVSTTTYSVTCDKYEEFEVPYSTPQPGYKYVRFNFIVKNISDNDIYSNEKIRAIADGIQCQRKDYYKNVPELPVSYISPGAKIIGYIGFIIPENAKILQLKYGDYVTINIDMNK